MDVQKYEFEKLKRMDLIEGIMDAYYSSKNSIMVAWIDDPLVNQLSDASLTDEGPGIARILQMHFNCHYLVLTWEVQEEVRMIAFSDEKRVRAYEFLDYIISDFGLVKGNATYAEGKVSSVYLNVQMAQIDLVDIMEYILSMCYSYFETCDWIWAKGYGDKYKQDIMNMDVYQKKKVPWAYVKTVDIAPAGSKLLLRSLENESGIVLTADEDIYIMIGSRGEIYDIKKDKFQSTYDATEEVLDVFGQMLDFLPEVLIIDSGEYVMLDSSAKLCYPKTDAKIYAKEINNRTKIFPVQEEQEYYLGRPGDYMAVRMDDLDDLYIIQADIFCRTYEKVKKV
ncbi:MAG: hypothetical protein ACI4F4_00830 [Lachnospiraceae bacterium]